MNVSGGPCENDDPQGPIVYQKKNTTDGNDHVDGDGNGGKTEVKPDAAVNFPGLRDTSPKHHLSLGAR